MQFDDYHVEPLQTAYAFIAICGGIARYLDAYTKGKPFKMSMFIASVIVSGFSGWCFAQLGCSLGANESWRFIMAGLGGFMGDNTMKYLWERVKTTK